MLQKVRQSAWLYKKKSYICINLTVEWTCLFILAMYLYFIETQKLLNVIVSYRMLDKPKCNIEY